MTDPIEFEKTIDYEKAGMVIKHGKITKLKGDLLEISAGSSSFSLPKDHEEVTLTVRLDGELYDERTDYSYRDGEPLMCRSVELYGPDAKCVSPEHWDRIVEAQNTVEKWKLPGVKGLDDIKKAPKEISKIIINSIVYVLLSPKADMTAIHYISWFDKMRAEGKTKGIPEDILDQTSFKIAVVYDTFKCSPLEIFDLRISDTLALIKNFWGVTPDHLKTEIGEMHKAIVDPTA